MKWIQCIMLLLAGYCLPAQTFTEKISREFAFEKTHADNALVLANINGNVSVQGYAGDKILVEITRTITGKTQARLDKGKQQIQLGVVDLADTILLFVKGTCSEFGRNLHKDQKGYAKGWGYQWNNHDDSCEELFDYKMDFVVKVPTRINVQVSTINDGNVSVVQVSGAVSANNINGSIKLQDLTREAVASTINGDVDIDYEVNPKKDCRFYSLNGDINAWFQKGLAANLSFESFNGEFYTNIDKLEKLPATLERSNNKSGLKLKVAGNRYQAGAGGILLDFETFNGNVYLKEKTR